MDQVTLQCNCECTLSALRETSNVSAELEHESITLEMYGGQRIGDSPCLSALGDNCRLSRDNCK